MAEIISQNSSESEQTPLYSVAQVRDITGLGRPDILYLLRLGLVNPMRIDQNGLLVRGFNQQEVDILKSAGTLREKGATPREIVATLTPELTDTKLLTEVEAQVIRLRYGGKVRKTFETIGEELGLARQTVNEIDGNATAKLARAYIMRENLSS